jgi:hypothetical protein
MIDQDEVTAAANRLRQSGWMRPSDEQTPEQRQIKKLRKVHRPERDKGFGDLPRDARSAGLWLATNPGAARHPLRPFLVERFGLSFDDAGRAIAEAERLTGATL